MVATVSHPAFRELNADDSLADRARAIVLLRESLSLIPRVASSPLMIEKLDFGRGSYLQFLALNPDPIDWFANRYSLDAKAIQAKTINIGIVLYLPEREYKKFLCSINLTPCGASWGMALTLSSLPEHLQNRFVVVNTGGEGALRRSDESIQITEKHEVLHLIRNRFFASAPFMSSNGFIRELERMNITDPEQHRELAKRLANGMIEISCSEIISYNDTGMMSPSRRSLGATFWKQHMEVLHSMLIRNAVRPEVYQSECRKIARIYKTAYQEYCHKVNKFRAFARLIYNDSALPPEEKTAEVLRHPPDRIAALAVT